MTSLRDAIAKAGLGDTLKLTTDGDLAAIRRQAADKKAHRERKPPSDVAAESRPQTSLDPTSPTPMASRAAVPPPPAGRKSVLVIGVDSPTFSKVEPLLERATFEVDRFPRGRASLELVSVVGFAALLVRYPLPDMELRDFLDELRRPGSKSLKTPVVLLTENGEAGAAHEYIGKGANRILPISETAGHLQSAISELLQVAPRLGTRLVASLEVRLDEGTSLAMCQTENVSVSGMLVRTNVGYPIGTRLGFEFALPGEPRPARGEAEVVRHTTVGREMTRGVGCRFVHFEGDGERRFISYVHGQLDEHGD